MFGCRVIQKYLETNKNQPQGQHILKKLLEMAIPLSQCQYGNYVMQHIVTKCKEESKKIVQIFLPNIVILSTNKYASNVVEKAIQSVEGVFREELAEWFITVGQKEYFCWVI
jgi:pumilio RNA-binding family